MIENEDNTQTENNHLDNVVINDSVAAVLKQLSFEKSLQGVLLASFVKNDSDEKLNDNIEIKVYRQAVVPFLTWAKLNSALSYKNAIDIAVIDDPASEFRFTVRYIIQSLQTNSMLTVTTKTNEVLSILTSQELYPAFNWAEREAWDMFGVMFSGHPDLRRILTDYGFVGHPLKKDYPLSGFTEISYSDESKRIEQTKIEMTQRSKPVTGTGTWIKQ